MGPRSQKLAQELGKEGEAAARVILKEMGYSVQSPDWIAEKDGVWTCFEIKKKRSYNPPPFKGHGLDERQIFLRNKFFNATKIRTYLMIFDVEDGKVYGNFLDILMAKDSFVTRLNKIRIFPIENFNIIK